MSLRSISSKNTSGSDLMKKTPNGLPLWMWFLHVTVQKPQLKSFTSYGTTYLEIIREEGGCRGTAPIPRSLSSFPQKLFWAPATTGFPAIQLYCFSWTLQPSWTCWWGIPNILLHPFCSCGLFQTWLLTWGGAGHDWYQPYQVHHTEIWPDEQPSPLYS